MLRANLKWKLVSRLVGSCLVLMLTLGIASCERSPAANNDSAAMSSSAMSVTDGPLAEVNTPMSILQLAPSLEKYQPQVEILSPQSDEILSDDRVTVKFKVTDLPLFKQPQLGLGNHLHVILDKQTYQGVYDLSQPLVFKNLTPGTHSLRVFASRPWHESFKNEAAFDRVTFHVLTKTAENNPDPQQPLLTYSRPAGTYSAEPIMLDYYLTNAPSHPVSPGSRDLPDWRVRVTINDQRFILDRWAPVYLQGFKEGKNWVRLELVDDRGNPLPNVYNDTVGLVTYDPRTKDSLAQLIRGELSPELAQGLVNPNSTSIPTSTLANSPRGVSPVPNSTPAPLLPQPIAIAPPLPKPSPTPTIEPTNPLPVPLVKAPNPAPNPAQPEIDRSISPSPQPKPTATIAPSPIPAPIVIVPVPVPVPPAPSQKPAPAVAKTAPNPIAPVVIPVPAIQPTPTSAPKAIAIVPPQIPVQPAPAPTTIPAPPVATQPQLPAPVAPPTAPPSTVIAAGEKTWQTQTIELIEAAKVKIRAFTNTIPAKAQRFARNMQIWTGKAIEFIDSLRDSPK
ncbi:hypothetical protein [Chamaesiphon sp. OTE_20_metabat_361]|uniref:hypothetical protein n=1 Tax=Chamaesiphon sp. OTE_20_metabat_361 TaxID=2964689 RepID=UPI00286AF2AD|nr:hypothetical protein [Chamaesiphon sp. OTE_20_metabat_361]